MQLWQGGLNEAGDIVVLHQVATSSATRRTGTPNSILGSEAVFVANKISSHLRGLQLLCSLCSLRVARHPCDQVLHDAPPLPSRPANCDSWTPWMHLAGSLLQNISQVWTDKSNYKQGTFSPLQVVVAKITTGGLLALQV